MTTPQGVSVAIVAVLFLCWLWWWVSDGGDE